MGPSSWGHAPNLIAFLSPQAIPVPQAREPHVVRSALVEDCGRRMIGSQRVSVPSQAERDIVRGLWTRDRLGEKKPRMWGVGHDEGHGTRKCATPGNYQLLARMDAPAHVAQAEMLERFASAGHGVECEMG